MNAYVTLCEPEDFLACEHLSALEVGEDYCSTDIITSSKLALRATTFKAGQLVVKEGPDVKGFSGSFITSYPFSRTKPTTWEELTCCGIFSSHNQSGSWLYIADVVTIPFGNSYQYASLLVWEQLRTAIVYGLQGVLMSVADAGKIPFWEYGFEKLYSQPAFRQVKEDRIMMTHYMREFVRDYPLGA